VVVVVGLTDGPAELLVKPAGVLVHEYVVAPAALKLTLNPEQIFVLEAFAVTTIGAETVTVKGIAADTQPVTLLRTVI
jgi:hypothetical protein